MKTSERYDEESGEISTDNSSFKKRKNKGVSPQHDNISRILFPEVSNPMVDVDGYDEEEDQSEYETILIEGICKAGYLKKKSTSMRKDWLIRWFFIKDGKLFYVRRHTDLIG
jgi:hypothetical protein